MGKVKNPIIPGFYPDPSICRVGEDYYIVNSSFSYFPGVPIIQSKDLQNFKQIGNILSTNTQLPLPNQNARMSQGIFAPTIRYNNGTYYMITTNVSFGGNFIVTATSPTGPWSEPHYIKDAAGIDPSLFFDEDGKCYYIGTRPNPDGVRYNGDWWIYIQELDIENFCLKGDYTLAWKGSMINAEWPEGPHLYKIDEYYYIMHAEGGTGPNHAVCIARSKEVFGPYEGYKNNPIITHRHLGKDYPIRYVGHADLVDTPDGDWYMIMLASRPCDWFTGMGRETFIAKVIWEDGWPVVNPGVGILADEQEIDLPVKLLDKTPIDLENDKKGNTISFDKMVINSFPSVIPHEMIAIRNHTEPFYALDSEAGTLTLNTAPDVLTDLAPLSYLGIRQFSYNYEAMTECSFDPKAGEEAGLVLLQSEAASLRFVLTGDGKTNSVKLATYGDVISDGSEERVEKMIFEKEIGAANRVIFKFKQEGQNLKFFYSAVENGTAGAEIEVPACVNAKFLSTEAAGGFVGNTIGMYTSSNHQETANKATFYRYAVVNC